MISLRSLYARFLKYSFTFCSAISKQKGHSAFMLASWDGHTEIVRMLLGHPGINVNRQDKVKLFMMEGSYCILLPSHNLIIVMQHI